MAKKKEKKDDWKEWKEWKGKDGRWVKIQNNVFPGALWFIGWLFTIGFLDQSFWTGVLGIIIWPYYLGEYISLIVLRG